MMFERVPSAYADLIMERPEVLNRYEDTYSRTDEIIKPIADAWAKFQHDDTMRRRGEMPTENKNEGQEENNGIDFREYHW